MIYFYPKDDTPGCTKEAIGFSCIYDRFKTAASRSSASPRTPSSSHDKFKRKHGLRSRWRPTRTGELVEAYGAWVEKSMYGKKYMGIDRSTFLVGEDGRIRKAWRGVKVPGPRRGGPGCRRRTGGG